ncbi:MAG: lipoate--protein ligase family protein [Anaerolineae bacterium]|nr:lipoate--protein ligase family protein [Anaerolineae bacterium]
MTHSPQTWRLLTTPEASGAFNMALDHSILEQVGAGNLPPTLRLYGWNPACLSLGQAQPASDADAERLRARGWDLVRRPTGGRAILHTDEITYSVAFPADHALVQGDIVTSYRRLSAALLVALEHLGYAAQADKRHERVPEAAKGPVCFEVPSDYEITADGRKLIGSAQVRKFGGVLQHGSLPLMGDITRICDALTFPDEATREQVRARVQGRATTLAAALGRAASWNEAARVLAEAFAASFGVLLEPAEPTPAEQERAAELVETVYGAATWTARR